MTDETRTFQDAVFDMGQLFKDMKTKFGVPPAVTMDIVRLQLMYMQTTNAPTVADPNMEVIEAEPEETDE